MFWESFLDRITENDLDEGEPTMRSLTLLPYTENHFLHPRPCDRSFSTFLRSKVNASHPKNLAEGGMTAQKSQGDHRRSKDQRRGFPDDCTVKSA